MYPMLSEIFITFWSLNVHNICLVLSILQRDPDGSGQLKKDMVSLETMD